MTIHLSNRSKALLAGLFIIAAIVLILIFLPSPGAEPEPTPESVISKEIEEPVEVSIPEQVPLEISEQEVVELSAATIGTIFVERFGSYSTESNLANIEDVLPLTTEKYRQELTQLISNVRAAGPSSQYYGVTTRVVTSSATNTNIEIGTATLTILTQREETIGELTNTSLKYQSIIVEMQKVGDDWRVDDAIWQ